MAPLWVRICFQQRKTNGPFYGLGLDPIKLQIVSWSWNESKPFSCRQGTKIGSSPESRFLSSECPGNKGLIFNFRLIFMFLLRASPIDKIFCSHFKKIKKLSKFARKESDSIFSLLTLHHLSWFCLFSENMLHSWLIPKKK